MRCYCCDKILSDFESTRKSVNTGEYLDMCNKCYSTIKEELHAEERYDLFDGDEEQLEDKSFLSNDLDFGVDNPS
jgi:hypothetical protein